MLNKFSNFEIQIAKQILPMLQIKNFEMKFRGLNNLIRREPVSVLAMIKEKADKLLLLEILFQMHWMTQP